MDEGEQSSVTSKVLSTPAVIRIIIRLVVLVVILIVSFVMSLFNVPAHPYSGAIQKELLVINDLRELLMETKSEERYLNNLGKIQDLTDEVLDAQSIAEENIPIDDNLRARIEYKYVFALDGLLLDINSTVSNLSKYEKGEVARETKEIAHKTRSRFTTLAFNR